MDNKENWVKLWQRVTKKSKQVESWNNYFTHIGQNFFDYHHLKITKKKGGSKNKCCIILLCFPVYFRNAVSYQSKSLPVLEKQPYMKSQGLGGCISLMEILNFWFSKVSYRWHLSNLCHVLNLYCLGTIFQCYFLQLLSVSVFQIPRETFELDLIHYFYYLWELMNWCWNISGNQNYLSF